MLEYNTYYTLGKLKWLKLSIEQSAELSTKIEIVKNIYESGVILDDALKILDIPSLEKGQVFVTGEKSKDFGSFAVMEGDIIVDLYGDPNKIRFPSEYLLTSEGNHTLNCHEYGYDSLRLHYRVNIVKTFKPTKHALPKLPKGVKGYLHFTLETSKDNEKLKMRVTYKVHRHIFVRMGDYYYILIPLKMEDALLSDKAVRIGKDYFTAVDVSNISCACIGVIHVKQFETYRQIIDLNIESDDAELITHEAIHARLAMLDAEYVTCLTRPIFTKK